MPTRDINIKNLFDSLPHRTYTFEVGEGRFEALVPYGNGSIKGVKRILFQYTERRIIIFSNELRYQNQGFNTELFGEKAVRYLMNYIQRLQAILRLMVALVALILRLTSKSAQR